MRAEVCAPINAQNWVEPFKILMELLVPIRDPWGSLQPVLQSNFIADRIIEDRKDHLLFNHPNVYFNSNLIYTVTKSPSSAGFTTVSNGWRDFFFVGVALQNFVDEIVTIQFYWTFKCMNSFCLRYFLFSGIMHLISNTLDTVRKDSS